jgi:hypothetical protein
MSDGDIPVFMIRHILNVPLPKNNPNDPNEKTRYLPYEEGVAKYFEKMQGGAWGGIPEIMTAVAVSKRPIVLLKPKLSDNQSEIYSWHPVFGTRPDDFDELAPIIIEYNVEHGEGNHYRGTRLAETPAYSALLLQHEYGRLRTARQVDQTLAQTNVNVENALQGENSIRITDTNTLQEQLQAFEAALLNKKDAVAKHQQTFDKMVAKYNKKYAEIKNNLETLNKRPQQQPSKLSEEYWKNNLSTRMTHALSIADSFQTLREHVNEVIQNWNAWHKEFKKEYTNFLTTLDGYGKMRNAQANIDQNALSEDDNEQNYLIDEIQDSYKKLYDNLNQADSEKWRKQAHEMNKVRLPMIQLEVAELLLEYYRLKNGRLKNGADNVFGEFEESQPRVSAPRARRIVPLSFMDAPQVVDIPSRRTI